MLTAPLNTQLKNSSHNEPPAILLQASTQTLAFTSCLLRGRIFKMPLRCIPGSERICRKQELRIIPYSENSNTKGMSLRGLLLLWQHRARVGQLYQVK
jgi:hypothetical protein